jgi:protoheme IX farnesyltransferase
MARPRITAAAAATDGSIGIRARERWDDLIELTKARLSGMVVITTAVGFILASPASIDWWKLIWTCVGTFLAAAGASAFNQAWEVERDRKMRRTADRPIPAGRISRRNAAAFAFFISAVGIAILCPTSNGFTAVLGLANIAIYVLIYTPLKPRSTFNTLVGAVVGALPPIMGWVAARGHLALGGLLLGAILLVWQIPHFLALAWMYRVDYAAGGYRMLPAVDPTGRMTGRTSVIWAMTLVPLALGLMTIDVVGVWAAIVALVLGLGFVALALRFAFDRTDRNARQLFFASIIYLPLLLGMLVIDRVPAKTLPTATHHAAGVSWVE